MDSKDHLLNLQEDKQLLSMELINSLKKEKSEFMGQLVHNLKNPVGSALSFSDMILEDVDRYAPEKLKRHLNIIKSSCEAALNQLEIALIEARIDAKEIELHLQETLFSEMIKKCLSEQEKNFTKNNFTIQSSFSTYEKLVHLDRNFIKHSISGLLQFLHLHAGNNTVLKIDLITEDNKLILVIESNQCDKCNERIEEFNKLLISENGTLFNLKQEKYLNFKNIAFIAEKHQGYFNVAKNNQNSLVLTFAISTDL